MNLDELADEAKKENILAVVAAMSRTDGLLHDKEVVYLLRLGLNLGLTDKQVRDVLQDKFSTIYVPADEESRMTILYYLVFLMKADGIIEKAEIDLLHHFGLRLGFNPLMIDNIIAVITAAADQPVPKDAILQEVKKYLN